MKQLIILATLIISSSQILWAQTAIYKHFANRPQLYAYCMERYPLTDADTANVTLLNTGDSTIYQVVIAELKALPFSPNKKNMLRPEGIMSATTGKEKPHAGAKKSLEIWTADAMTGDNGWYIICTPSDRMTVLIFLVKSTEEMLSVLQDVIHSEFKK